MAAPVAVVSIKTKYGLYVKMTSHDSPRLEANERDLDTEEQFEMYVEMEEGKKHPTVWFRGNHYKNGYIHAPTVAQDARVTASPQKPTYFKLQQVHILMIRSLILIRSLVSQDDARFV